MKALEECIPLDPLHNPANIIGIKACQELMPGVPMVAVFDTAFHMTMPPKAYRYAIPTKYYTEDHLRRYGFHGTSHRFVSKRCIELMGGVENAHRVIVCHLGNGSSLSAVKDGKCQDTSMGLSPLAGVPMGTRAGDIDTCVAQFIMNKYNMSADDCLTMLNKKSGVLALSDGISSDFRDLDAAAEKGNEAAQLALDKFAYEVRKYIGAYAAALGGVDCIVFTAGVGENSGSMRASICDGLEYLGVKLDPEKNKLRGEEVVISTSDSKVTVWVIPTNEELMIAQDTAALEIAEGEDYCTLVTCTPYGINTHRLLVRGRRVETPDQYKHLRVTAEALKIEPIIVAPIMALPMLLILLIGMLLSTRKPKKTRGEEHEKH